MTVRLWALVTLGVLLAALAVVAALTVPWHRAPAPRADQIAALGQLPAEQVARARQFRSELRPGGYLSMAVGLLVTLALGLTPAGARLVELAGRPFGGHWLARAVLGGLLVVLAGELLTLPFAAWRHTIAVRYGISTQSWGGWSVDLLKSLAVGAVLGGLALAGFFTVTHFAPRWWWAFGAAGAAGLVVLLSFVLPVLVEPVFNRFTPMPDGPLRTELIALADADGVPVRDVLVADASRRTRAVNAYVSGLGPTRRIVVYDTMLTEATPDEVLSVAAHELGHAKDGDVLTGTILGALGAAVAVIAVYLLGSWSGLLRLAGVDSIGEPRAIGLLLALAAIAGLAAGPVQAFVSRRIEARADRHALALTGDPQTFEAMQRRLGTVNLSDPDPPSWEFLMFASHPSTVQRMAAARAYARGER
ncbi:M48 family metallopeptidase [Actinoplanes teichomyceticus]|uniref:STE24 endopeptidase n=1 Tax=Actinoplanes teichomyceticus TaxID=1867 RepID=A0A561WIQ7_ACTTI|nr:M48 family metallopeptidase [Actinoplanes teichomyceticus]TWG23779.1 STE24 endopeptidase [Actinoplanes teichomyceticus]GIF11825.1 Ste24 endopeptidase [Actinoplanes teichomyceticus]